LHADCAEIACRAALSEAFAASFTDCIFFIQLLRIVCRAALRFLGRWSEIAAKNCRNCKTGLAVAAEW
jgi:hypothetical protein